MSTLAMRILNVLGVLMSLVWWGLAPAPAVASEADSYWMCKTSTPVGWCPTSSTNPLPVTAAVGSVTDVNLIKVSGTPVVPATAPVPVGLYNPIGGALLDPTLPAQVVGAGAASTPAIGNPVGIGCVYAITPPTYADGDRVNCVSDNRGGISTVIKGGFGTALSEVAALSSAGVNPGAGALYVQAFNRMYTGATFEVMPSCTSTAVVNVTAANTTQIVALSGSTSILVCSFDITASLAGTFKFVNGTGSNCGTGTADITGAMAISTNSSNTLSGSNGTVFRVPASNALCLTAVTGNMTGFVTYAQY